MGSSVRLEGAFFYFLNTLWVLTFLQALEKWKSQRKTHPPRQLNPKQIREVKALQERPPKHCTFCVKPLTGRRTQWCGDACVSLFFLALNDPKVVEYHVERRDRGRCAACGLNIDAHIKGILNSTDKLEDAIPLLCEALGIRSKSHRETIKTLAFYLNRKRLWDIDHKIPVSKGGGLCGLENFETLCVRCHKEKTHG